jgi:tripartite-type tricarboxylate transporter receptor subunit TctC
MSRIIGALSAGILALSLGGLAAPEIASAEFPEQPITYVISFDPGGESDVTARFQEPHLEEKLGVDVVVTHRPGGGGAVAWSEFQRNAQPDGYTIIGINIPHIVAQPIQRADAGYDTFDWEIITWFHFTPNALIVRNDSPFKTLQDLIEFAKKNPQVVTVGGSGTFSANHLEMLRLEKAADIDLTYIPFTGTGPLPAAVLGGHVSALMNYTMLGVQMSDEVRVLAVASEERVPTLPDAPTFRELGYDIVGGAYRGVAAPKGTPKEIVDKLAQVLGEVNELIREKQEPLGFVMTHVTGQDATKLVDQMRQAYGDVLKAEGKDN